MRQADWRSLRADELARLHQREWGFIEAVLPLLPLLAAGTRLTPTVVFRQCGARKGAVVMDTIGWLPKGRFEIPGSLHTEYRTCGVLECPCADGDLHGPYTFHHWRDQNHKQHREYIPVGDVDWVSDGVERWAIAHPDKRREPSLELRQQRVLSRRLNRWRRSQ